MTVPIAAGGPFRQATSLGSIGTYATRLEWFLRRSHRWAIAALVLLYLAHLSGRLELSNDASLYMLLGRSITEGQGYTLCGIPHAHVPPGFPLLLAGVTTCFSENAVVLNLVMLLISGAALWLVWLALREMTTRSTALLITLVVGFSWEMFLHSGIVLSDVPFMTVVWGGLVCCQRGLQGRRGWLAAGAALLVASCWIRVLGFPIALAAIPAILLYWRRIPWPRLVLSLAILIVGVVVTFAVFKTRYNQARLIYRTQTYAGHVKKITDRTTQQMWRTPLVNLFHTGKPMLGLFMGQAAQTRLLALLPSGTAANLLAVVVLGIPMLAGAARGLRCGQWLPIFITAGYFGMLLVERVPVNRYLLPLAPLLVWYWLEGVRLLLEFPPGLRGSAPRLAAACGVLLICLNVPNDAYRVYADDTGRRLAYQQTLDSLHEVAGFLRHNARSSDMLIGDMPYQLSYLTRLPFLQNPKARIRSYPKWKTELPSLLRRYEVKYVVHLNESWHKWEWRQLPAIAAASPELERVFHNEHYTVYRVCDGASFACCESASRQSEAAIQYR